MTEYVYVTRYCLSSGKIERREVDSHSNGGKSVFVKRTYQSLGKDHFYGLDWHSSAEKALIDAEEKRIKKIASLKKQIAKLEAMKFEVIE